MFINEVVNKRQPTGMLAAVVGAIVGGVIASIVSYTLMILDIKVQFVDYDAAAYELKSAQLNIEEMLNNDEKTIPQYKVLNMNLEWKEVLVNYNDSDLYLLFNFLNRLDDLRPVIMTESDLNNRIRLIREHNIIMEKIINEGLFESIIKEIESRS
ncbi:hypothetical protein ACH6EH_03680 [Paenibacillus sp. JSM ZJ436]|uniref:hypothetical protein n=1 Tax=Paenibacillus sp. JSM ZJ436 TaxID=3376190 RepID=UPI0037B50E04